MALRKKNTGLLPPICRHHNTPRILVTPPHIPLTKSSQAESTTPSPHTGQSRQPHNCCYFTTYRAASLVSKLPSRRISLHLDNSVPQLFAPCYPTALRHSHLASVCPKLSQSIRATPTTLVHNWFFDSFQLSSKPHCRRLTPLPHPTRHGNAPTIDQQYHRN